MKTTRGTAVEARKHATARASSAQRDLRKRSLSMVSHIPPSTPKEVAAPHSAGHWKPRRSRLVAEIRFWIEMFRGG